MRVDFEREPRPVTPLNRIVIRGVGVSMVTIERTDGVVNRNAIASITERLPDGGHRPLVELDRADIRKIIEGLEEMLG